MKEQRIRGSSIGQFDLIKGIGILCIVVKHSLGVFDVESVVSATAAGVALGVLMRIFNNMIVPAFFVISGYGFRQEKVKISLKRQAKYLLVPYVIVMLVTSLLNLLIHYATFHYSKGAILETSKVLGGFLLGAATNLTIGDVVLFSNGACWYLLALFLSWIILELFFEYGGRYRTQLVIATVVAGWLLSWLAPEMPYGIPQAMIAVGYLYLGYESKKQHWLYTSLRAWQYMALIALSLLTILFGNVVMASNVWKLGLLDILANAAYALLFIRLILFLNRYQNRFFQAVSYLGRLSLWIICVQTVEFIAVPWYLLQDKFSNEFYGVIIVLAASSIIITAGTFIVITAMKYKLRITKKMSRKVKVEGCYGTNSNQG